MRVDEKVLYADGGYRVVDMVYNGRPARVLFYGDTKAAQSGIALDGGTELLFDYNQRFMELVEYLSPKRLLVIGGGVYTFPLAVLQRYPNTSIDVIEPNTLLDALAAHFFGLVSDERLRIVHTDGSTFLQENSSVYDLVVVDAFDEYKIPVSVTARQTVEQIHKHLNGDGLAAMNVVSAYQGRGGEIMRHYCDIYHSVFNDVAVHPADSGYSLWLPQNLLLVAGDKPLAELPLRFGALPPAAD